MANLRRDGLHKLTTRLAHEYGTIVVEDLNVAGMLRNRRLARHIADAGFGEIRRQLAYKTEWNGGRLVVADRWYPSSKTCSGCGAVKAKLTLAERTYTCTTCGMVLDRDLNAARNLAALAAEVNRRREWPGDAKRTWSRPEDPPWRAGGCEASTRHRLGGSDRDRPTARRDCRSCARLKLTERQRESATAFTPSGDLLFLAARPDPEQADGDEEPAASLWLLPADGAEARLVATRTAGLGGLRTAADAPVVLLASDVLPRATDAADDERRRKERKEKKVTAILHATYPIRYWDRDLGPAAPHLFTARLDTDLGEPVAGRAEPRLDLHDLTPDAPATLTEQSADIAPDGRTVVATWRVPAGRGAVRDTLVAIDVARGERRVLVDDPEADLSAPVISPDGRRVAYLRETLSTPQRAPRFELWVAELATGQRRQVVAQTWDRWPAAWRGPGTARRSASPPTTTAGPGLPRRPGHRRRSPGSPATTPPTPTYGSPHGGVLYALRSSTPPRRTRSASTRRRGPRHRCGHCAALRRCPNCPARSPRSGDRRRRHARAVVAGAARRSGTEPGAAAAVDPRRTAGQLERLALAVEPVAAGRAGLRGAAARPGAVHRLRPGLHPARLGRMGRRAVHRPDGGHRRGRAPTRDIDETRTAAMGGSFGGYMANWIAGHTDRFDAIVTHASLWALDQFGPTTDAAYYWAREMTAEMATGQLAAPLRRARSAPRCWSSTATRTIACRSVRRCGCGTSC